MVQTQTTERGVVLTENYRDYVLRVRRQGARYVYTYSQSDCWALTCLGTYATPDQAMGWAKTHVDQLKMKRDADEQDEH